MCISPADLQSWFGRNTETCFTWCIACIKCNKFTKWMRDRSHFFLSDCSNIKNTRWTWIKIWIGNSALRAVQKINFIAYIYIYIYIRHHRHMQKNLQTVRLLVSAFRLSHTKSCYYLNRSDDSLIEKPRSVIWIFLNVVHDGSLEYIYIWLKFIAYILPCF